MSVIRCERCDRDIDTDYDTDHEADCLFEAQESDTDPAPQDVEGDAARRTVEARLWRQFDAATHDPQRIRLGHDPAGVEVVCCQFLGEGVVDFMERAQIEADDLEDLTSVHLATMVRLLEAEAARIGAEVKAAGTDPDRIAERRQDSNDCKLMAVYIRAGHTDWVRRLFSAMHNPELILPSEVTKWIEARGGRLA